MANWEATMVEVSVDYKGQLHCLAKHGPSGARIETDAPTDNQGKGEEFSPTDLVAAALGTCMATVMGIAASKKEIELDGLRINVTKEMSTEPPRQIAKLLVEIFMPVPEDHPEAKILKGAAMGCPVRYSINPEIEVPIQWSWR